MYLLNTLIHWFLETPASFVPLVDFKERPQQWKWIGDHMEYTY